MNLSRHAVNNRCTPVKTRAMVKSRHQSLQSHRIIWSAASMISLAVLLALTLTRGAAAQQEEPKLLTAGQPIAILETVAPIPLSCSDGECTATLSSISLDEYSPLPAPDQAFALIEGEGQAVLFNSPDSQTKNLTFDQLDVARIVADRGYSRVRVSIPEAALLGAGLGTEQVTVSITRTAVGQAVDDELAVAKGAALPKAQLSVQGAVEYLSASGSDHQAGLIAGQLIARTIAKLTADATVADVDAKWAQVKAEAASKAGIPEVSLHMVEGALARCASDINGLLPAETCLWSHHDGFVSELNRAYWRAVAAGA